MVPTAPRGPRRPGELDLADSVIDGLDERGLAVLLTTRPDLADPPPASRAELAARAASGASVKRCIERLDRHCLQVLTACAVLGDGASVDDLPALLGAHASMADVDRAISVLAERLVVRREGGTLRVHPVVASMPSPAGLGLPASDLLGELTVEDLKVVCAGLGSRLAGNERKASIVAVLLRVLTDPERVRSVLAAAPESARILAGKLAGGPPTVYDSYGLSNAYSRYASARDLALPHVWLARRGLVVRHDWSGAMMPREVALALRGGQLFPSVAASRPALPTVPAGVDLVDSLATGKLLSTISGIERLIEHLGAHPAQLLKAGGLGVRELRKLAAVTDAPEHDATLLVELAAVAGLVVTDWESRTACPSTGCDDWLASDAATRWTRLVTSWLATPTFPSLAGTLDENGKPYPALSDWATHHAPAAQRRRALDLLAETEPGSTTEPGALACLLDWDAPLLLSHGPADPATHTTWIWREAETLGVLASGALSTAGRALATEGVGRAAEIVSSAAPAPSSSVVLQADLTAMAAGQLDSTVRRELELLADVESKGAATVYRFSETSLRRGFDAGRSADQILAFLTSHAAKGVPQALSYLVGDIARRFGRMRIGTAASYVRFEDPVMAAEVLRTKRSARLGLRQIAPTVLVSDSGPGVVLEALRAAGFHPAHEGRDGALLASEPARHRSGTTSTRRDALGRPPQHAGAPDATAHGKASRDALVADIAHRLATDTGGPDGAGPLPAASGSSTSRRTTNGSQLHLLGGEIDGELRPHPSPQVLLSMIADLLSDPEGHARADGRERPTAISRAPGEIAALLADAYENDWLVRLSFAGQRRGVSEATCDVLDVEGATVQLLEMSEGDELEIELAAIAWVRVLTEAEEEQWY